MSTKTSIKRIALVAVSALGFGLLSVVPASALTDEPADLTVFAPTAAQTVPSGTSSVDFPVHVGASAALTATKGFTVTITNASKPTGATTPTMAASTTSLAAPFAASGTAANTSTVTVSGAVFSTLANGTSGGTLATIAGGVGTRIGTATITGFDKPGTYTFAITPDGAGTDTAATVTVNVVETAVSVSTIAATSFAVGANGKAGSYVVRYQGSTTATDSVVNPKGRVLSSPALSTVAAGLLIGDGTVANGQAELPNGNTATNDVNATASTNSLTGKTYYDATFSFWPDREGAYSFIFFNDTNDNGFVDGSDTSATLSITVGSAVTSIVTSAMNTTAAVSGADGSLVKVTVKDVNGTAVAPTAAEGVLVSLTGSAKVAKVNNTAVTATSTYTLGTNDFDAAGTAYINVTNAVAETVTLTAVGNGSIASSVAATALGLTFKTAVDTAPILAPTATAKMAGTTPNFTVVTGSATAALEAAGTTDIIYKATITDTNGRLSGRASAKWDLALTAAASKISLSQGLTSTATGQGFTVTTNGGAITVASAAVNLTNGTVTLTPSSVSAIAGATTGIKALVKDQFGNALSSATITVTYSGRNTQLASSVIVTDSLGYATFTYTDTATGSVGATDTITFTATPATGSGSKAASATVTYNAANAVDTVTVTGGNTTAGVTSTVLSPLDISAGTAGPSATTHPLTATVKAASGAVLAGVPVTFTIAGSGAAIPSTKVTAYTDTNGVATGAAYGWIAGTYTYTATAGAKSATGTITFAQVTNNGEERVISATATGSVVTAKVVDRFGNVVPNVMVYATKSGAGYFGSGLTRTSVTTGNDGLAEFVISGGDATVTVSTINYASPAGTKGSGQTCAAAGYVDCADDLADGTKFTATTVGTTTTAETGVGATLSAAGVSSATASVTGVNSAVEAAADAAAEAIDAANAATDAANLAAEAADAATVAAEEARDAADAATAAVEELATQVATLMAALKAQITTLANTVAKIAKKVKA